VSKNVAVFVDVANIFYAAKAAGVDIDYVTLLKSATAGRDLVRAYAYTGLDPDNENQRNFHDFLRRHGYKVVSKDIRKYGDGKVKANLDIELVVDMMKTARNLDIAIVVSGDGDFAPAIRAVQEMGVRVEVISFRGNTSSDLIDVADLFSDIGALAKVEKGSSRSGRRVAGDEADLSMTAVPEKQSEGTGPARGRGRGRGRGRAVEPEPALARAAEAAAPGAIVALPGEKLSRARRAAPAPAAAAEVEIPTEPTESLPTAAEAPIGGVEAGAETADEAGQRRRRRRRGGRGRGRGRDLAAAAEGEVVGAADAAEPEAEFEEPRAPARANSTFGSVWDSQLGVSPARPGPAPSRPAQPAGGVDEEDLDEPPIPEYLIAERRGRGAGPDRGRGPRGPRGAYAAALDRERFGGGRSSGGVSRYPEPTGRRGPAPRRPDFPRDARPPRYPSAGGSGDEPWSEVPPELEAVLRAQLAARGSAAPARPGGSGGQPSASTAPRPSVAEPPSARRRTVRRPAPAAEVTPAAAPSAAAEAPAPKRRATRKAAAPVEPAVVTSAATGAADAPAPKRRTTRKTSPAAEPRATEPSAAATATPKRRTTRKTAAPDAG
jgi:uncharacterized LabA/DUF88 family protein